MKIRPVGAELLHACKQTDMTKRTVFFFAILRGHVKVCGKKCRIKNYSCELLYHFLVWMHLNLLQSVFICDFVNPIHSLITPIL